MFVPSILDVGCAKYVNSNEQCACFFSSENISDSIPELLNFNSSPGRTSRTSFAPTAVIADDSDATIVTCPYSFEPRTIGLNPRGSRAAYTALSSDTKVKQYEPAISFFRMDSALPSLPFVDISETSLCAATRVSLAFWG